MRDDGAFCAKKSYGRGAGIPMTCKPGEEYDAGLCYTPCESGWNGVGPVCWEQCPPGWFECGAICVENAGRCTAKVLSIVGLSLVTVVSAATGAY